MLVRFLVVFVVLVSAWPAAAQPAPIALVQIQNNYFDPAEVSVEAGGTVVWVARAGGHTVTADDGSFATSPLRAGEVLTLRFETPGEWRFRCVVHAPRMAGVIRVS